MKLEIIMITDFAFSYDFAPGNPVYKLDPWPCNEIQISGFSISVRPDHSRCVVDTGIQMLQRWDRLFGGGVVLMAPSALQPATAIIKRKGLRGMLRRQGLGQRAEKSWDELVIEESGSLRFWGMAKLSDMSDSDMPRFVRSGLMKYVVFDSHEGFELLQAEHVLRNDTSIDVPTINHWATRGDSLVASVNFGFDDPDASFLLFASPTKLLSVARRILDGELVQ